MNIEPNISPVNMPELSLKTGNIYKTVVIISRRSNQIGTNLKKELSNRLAEFNTSGDSLEEIIENREQIEIAKHFEAIPKPTILAVNEFLNNKIFWKDNLTDDIPPDFS